MSDPIDRRSVLRHVGVVGAGAVAITVAGGVTACSSTSSPTASPTASKPPAGNPATGAGTAPGAVANAVKKADVPVGGGKIISGLVVTQPSAGTFKAFSSTCTHEGCQVSEVKDNKIRCACHNSYFDAATGAVLSGPARSALPSKNVTDAGDSLTLA